MFPSGGYLAGVTCPFFKLGLCERPHCLFRHVAESTASSSVCVDVSQPAIDSNTDPAVSTDTTTTAAATDDHLVEHVTRAVLKALRNDTGAAAAAAGSTPTLSADTVSGVVDRVLDGQRSHGRNGNGNGGGGGSRCRSTVFCVDTTMSYRPTPLKDLRRRVDASPARFSDDDDGTAAAAAAAAAGPASDAPAGSVCVGTASSSSAGGGGASQAIGAATATTTTTTTATAEADAVGETASDFDLLEQIMSEGRRPVRLTSREKGRLAARQAAARRHQQWRRQQQQLMTSKSGRTSPAAAAAGAGDGDVYEPTSVDAVVAVAGQTPVPEYRPTALTVAACVGAEATVEQVVSTDAVNGDTNSAQCVSVIDVDCKSESSVNIDGTSSCAGAVGVRVVCPAASGIAASSASVASVSTSTAETAQVPVAGVASSGGGGLPFLACALPPTRRPQKLRRTTAAVSFAAGLKQQQQQQAHSAAETDTPAENACTHDNESTPSALSAGEVDVVSSEAEVEAEITAGGNTEAACTSSATVVTAKTEALAGLSADATRSQAANGQASDHKRPCDAGKSDSGTGRGTKRSHSHHHSKSRSHHRSGSSHHDEKHRRRRRRHEQKSELSEHAATGSTTTNTNGPTNTDKPHRQTSSTDNNSSSTLPTTTTTTTNTDKHHRQTSSADNNSSTTSPTTTTTNTDKHRSHKRRHSSGASASASASSSSHSRRHKSSRSSSSVDGSHRQKEHHHRHRRHGSHSSTSRDRDRDRDRSSYKKRSRCAAIAAVANDGGDGGSRDGSVAKDASATGSSNDNKDNSVGVAVAVSGANTVLPPVRHSSDNNDINDDVVIDDVIDCDDLYDDVNDDEHCLDELLAEWERGCASHALSTTPATDIDNLKQQRDKSMQMAEKIGRLCCDGVAAGDSGGGGGKKRVAHSGAATVARAPTAGGRPPAKRVSLAQSMHARWSRLIEMQEKQIAALQQQQQQQQQRSSAGDLSRGSSTVASSAASNTTVAGPPPPLFSSSSRTSHMHKKRRVAHVPNVAALLKPAAGSASSNSTLAASQQSSTVARTVDKHGGRVAHQPSVASVARPRIPVDSGGGKVAVAVRQRHLDLLCGELLKLHPNNETEAYKQALDLEHQAYSSVVSRVGYPHAVASTVRRLRELQRVGADVGSASASTTVGDHADEVGMTPTVGNRTMSHLHVLAGKGGARGSWSLEKHKREVQIASVGELYSRLQKYVMSLSQLELNGYPRPLSNSLSSSSAAAGSVVFDGRARLVHVDRRLRITAHGSVRRQCVRCAANYTVDEHGHQVAPQSTDGGGSDGGGQCVYHWGRVYNRRGDKRYSCCQMEANAEGCCVADVHVSDNFDPAHMTGYQRTLDKPDDDVCNRAVFALDCEMCYTTGGCELTRVTVVDMTGRTVYETFVRPVNPVIDYNTRFSGITEEDMRHVTTTLPDVQAVLLVLCSNKTILIGHSLESDFKALKLIHDTVVDTSVVFPHRLGAPYKRALRNLVSEHLQKLIQNDVGGHDSAEDATSCMDLMLWKIREDVKLCR